MATLLQDREAVTITSLSEFYLSDLRAGKAAPIESYSNAFPHLAEEIREQFPVLKALETAVGKSAPAAEERDPQLSAVLGGCTIECEIGRGAMGVVYKAHQADFDRTVAVKVIPLHGSSKGTIERFELERRALARLEHPAIVPVFSYGHDAHVAYLVMRYVDGVSLDRVLSESASYRMKTKLFSLQADWHTFATAAASIASGLHHAHEKGLVHRDVKPANLLLDENNNIWITDFGLVKWFDNQRAISQTGDAIGTPRYMAPEQLRGVCDRRSDVYSLGITLYELASGRRAWAEQDADILAIKSKSVDLQPIQEAVPHIPAGLATIIAKACEFAPEQRYQSAAEMAFVLERFASGHAKAERRSRRRFSDETYKLRRRRIHLAAAFLGISTFLAGLGYNVLKARGPASPGATSLTSANQATLPRPLLFAHPLADLRNQPARSDGEQFVAPAPIPAPEARLIDHMADPSSGDVGEVFSEYVKDSINHVDPELQNEQQRQAEIQQEMRSAADEFERQELGDKSINQLLAGYRRSTLPQSTALINLNPVFERSGLTRGEKDDAHQVLREYAGLVMKKRIPLETCNQMLLHLTKGERVGVNEFSTLNAPDALLREWLAVAKRHVAIAPAAHSVAPDGLSTEVVRILGESLQHAEVAD